MYCYGHTDKAYIGRDDLTNDAGGMFDYDLMTIKLKESSSFIPVMLDNGYSDLSYGFDVAVMEWGTTSFGGASSNIMMEVEEATVSNSQCNTDYGVGIMDVMMCASRSGKDCCQRDNGGTLIIKGEDASKDSQIGVVSWGNCCADADFSGVYVRSSTQVEWIKKQVESGTELDEGNSSDSGDNNGGA